MSEDLWNLPSASVCYLSTHGPALPWILMKHTFEQITKTTLLHVCRIQMKAGQTIDDAVTDFVTGLIFPETGVWVWQAEKLGKEDAKSPDIVGLGIVEVILQ